MTQAPAPDRSIETAVAAIDWPRVGSDLDARGYALTGRLVGREDCAALIAGYDNRDIYRSRIVMAHHGFGRGEYQYFRYPLPDVVARLRRAVYPNLVPTANRWAEALKREERFPRRHEDLITRCRSAGQVRPTPLILRYGEGDYNCLHQDLYGEHVFPLQLALLLSTPGDAFQGGEFVLTEQRPRMQSRAQVVPLGAGEGVVFAVNERPINGKRGVYRTKMRHGVSRVLAGRRFTLGIIFHDAR